MSIQNNKSRGPKVSKRTRGNRIDWTPSMIAMLGSLPDKTIGEILDIRPDTIRKKRNRLNIPPYEEDYAAALYAAGLKDSELGIVPDIKIAEKLGIGVTHVRRRREELGIARFSRKHEWTPEEIAVLGVLNDVQIEKKFGICHDVVRQKRLRLGIPACKYPFNRNKS